MHAVLFSLLLAVAAKGGDSPDVVVVCPAEFRQAMQPWLQRRAEQGYIVEFVSNSGTADDIRQRIRAVAKEGKLRFVVLVGDVAARDAHSASPPDASQSKYCTPTFRVASTVDCFWGGGPDFVTDNPFADLDGDGVPDVAIGRLTAHSAGDLSTMLKKILAYEQCRDFGPWRTKINFVAGGAGFGDLADSSLEGIIRKGIALGVPAGYLTTLTHACWQSPYCPDPHAFHDRCLERLSEGALFWVYMGHGSPRELQPAEFPDCIQSVLGCEDCRQLKCGIGSPIAMFFCCYAGAFDESEDCLAEELLRLPYGPSAVVAGSSATMPYGMAALGWGAMHEYFDKHRGTIGELMLYAKRDMMADYNQPIWGLANAIVEAVAPAGVRPKAERREHVQLFQLFGDPTMSLRYPHEATISAPATAVVGQRIEVRGSCPVDGHATVELVLRRDRLRQDLSPRERYGTSSVWRQRFEDDYRRSNDLRLASSETEVVDGHLVAELTAPADAVGACCVRVFATGHEDCALGACQIQVVAAGAVGENATRVKQPKGSTSEASIPVHATLP